MKVMELNEFMIGDWVTCKKWRENPYRLTRINDNGKHNYGVTGSGSQVGPFLIEEIEPIPLTTEILEKNGFEWTTTHSYMVLVVDSMHIAFGFYKDCLSISDWNENGNTQITSIQCKFVHQLQHALRLCGIDKEIEL
jgi:hypothetical protein